MQDVSHLIGFIFKSFFRKFYFSDFLHQKILDFFISEKTKVKFLKNLFRFLFLIIL